MHVDEDFAKLAIIIFPSVEIDFVATNRRFLDVTFAAIWQSLALLRALDNFLNDLFSDDLCMGSFWLFQHLIFKVAFINQLSIQRLAEFGAIAI